MQPLSVNLENQSLYWDRERFARMEQQFHQATTPPPPPPPPVQLTAKL